MSARVWLSHHPQADWNKIYLKYCDGGSQTGDLADAVVVPGKGTIYYRGARIVRSLIANLLVRGVGRQRVCGLCDVM